MLIKVSQDNIYDGKREDGEWCPIALAIRAACPDVPKDFNVGDKLLASQKRYVMWRGQKFILPEAAGIFIEKFDNGRMVAPFEFELPGFEC